MPLDSLPPRVRTVALGVVRTRLAGYDVARAYAQLSDDELARRDIQKWTHDRGRDEGRGFLPIRSRRHAGQLRNQEVLRGLHDDRSIRVAPCPKRDLLAGERR